ncbi:MAG: TIGR00300 family protein [Phycisphaerae bacterium]
MIAERITLEGHLIDSQSLAGVMDEILALGGEFRILEVHIGQSRDERSHAVLEVRAPTIESMQKVLEAATRHGAICQSAEDVEIVPTDMDGAFPTTFYSTTNQQTYVRYQGQWREVQDQEMDCGLVHDAKSNAFRCVPIARIKRGDRVVCGHRGVRIVPLERQKSHGGFEFMASDISTEKPKTTIIRNCAKLMVQAKRDGKKQLLVAGPAIVHTGAAEHVVKLIERGYFNVLFAGNALATHDIEHNLFGTSLGVYLDRATSAEAGHEHHLRAINAIRREGGIAAAVKSGKLTGGIMHACAKHNVPYVLAGSLRDDGPLPEVITDVLVAQDHMRAMLAGVGFVLMVATALHSIATGNILPAWIPVVCVDISPPTLTKLADRGSFQTIGLVTDVEPFFRELLAEIEREEKAGKAG